MATLSAITIAFTGTSIVMAGLVPAIHVFFTVNDKKDVDARDIWREDALSRFSAGMTETD
jgi:hypothetical protein